MKIEGRTLQVLKNFSTINPSIVFKPGNSLTTCTPNKTMMAKATIGEQIDSNFAIYDISKFLSVLSLFNSPELDISTNYMLIKGEGQKVRFTFADPSLVVTPAKDIKMPDCEIKFELQDIQLSSTMKAMGVMQLPELAVVGEGGEMYLQAMDSKNPTSDDFKISLGETSLNFRMIFRADNLKLLPGDYSVSISKNSIAEFKGKDVTYWLATEASSTFG